MATVNKIHMFTISGVFEVTLVVWHCLPLKLLHVFCLWLTSLDFTHLLSLGKKNSYLSSNTTITCNRTDCDGHFACEITTLGSKEFHHNLKGDEILVLKGRLIATNTQNLIHQVMIYKHSGKLKVSGSDMFAKSLPDSIPVTGLGIIKTSEALIKGYEKVFHKGEDMLVPKLTTVLIVCHLDWNPLLRFSFVILMFVF